MNEGVMRILLCTVLKQNIPLWIGIMKVNTIRIGDSVGKRNEEIIKATKKYRP